MDSGHNLIRQTDRNEEIQNNKKRYILSFLAVTLLLALVRCVFPGVADKSTSAKSQIANSKVYDADSLDKDAHVTTAHQDFGLKPGERSRFLMPAEIL